MRCVTTAREAPVPNSVGNRFCSNHRQCYLFCFDACVAPTTLPSGADIRGRLSTSTGVGANANMRSTSALSLYSVSVRVPNGVGGLQNNFYSQHRRSKATVLLGLLIAPHPATWLSLHEHRSVDWSSRSVDVPYSSAKRSGCCDAEREFWTADRASESAVGLRCWISSGVLACWLTEILWCW